MSLLQISRKMNKGNANEGEERDPPICHRPDCKPAKASTHQIELADLLPLRLSKSAVFINYSIVADERKFLPKIASDQGMQFN